jgi:DNA-binding beta-propeller fold protein YncE
MKLLKFNVNFLLISFLLLAGCATDMPQTSKRYVWPQAPDEPKIEWLKSYYSQYDFPVSGFDLFVQTLFGQDPEINFERPVDIKSNGKGLVYVTDIVKGSIHVFDFVNYKVNVWSKGNDPERDLLITPYYIALDRDNNLYVVGMGDKKIFILDKNGIVIRKIDFEQYVKSPGGIVLDSQNSRIYLVDMTESKVAVFDISGKHLFSFGKFGDKDGEMNRPTSITINHKGEIIVGDTMNARIQIFNSEGKFLRKLGQRGDGAADFQILKGVAVDSDDNIYVTDGKANQIKIFNTNGQFLMSFGTAYSVTHSLREAPGGFLLPQGINIDETNTIYVVDLANVRFQVFKYLGSETRKEILPGTTFKPAPRQ